MTQPCGHPLAARMVVADVDRIYSACWACDVEAEIAAREAATLDGATGRSASVAKPPLRPVAP